MTWRHISKILCIFVIVFVWAVMAGIEQAQPPWTTTTCIDLDGDGYGNPASPACPHPELDCDDNNAAVNPGAAEGLPVATCSDGLDNDCNGRVDNDDDKCDAQARCNGPTYINTYLDAVSVLRVDMDGQMKWMFNNGIPLSIAFTRDWNILSLINQPTILDPETGQTLKIIRSYPGGHHSLTQTARGTYMYLKNVYYKPNYEPWGNCTLMGDYILEADEDGNTLWEWYLHEHVDPVEVHQPGLCEGTPLDTDWAHCNTVKTYQNYSFNGETYDMVVLLNSRRLDTFWMIDRDTGDIIWSCGQFGTFGRREPPEEPLFSGAHEVEMLENGNFIMFDNGTERSVQQSRALEIQVDPVAGIAEEVWSWTDPEMPMFSGWGGNADRLPNGNTLVVDPGGGQEGFRAPRVIEVTPDKRKVWEFRLDKGLFPSNPNVVSIYDAVRDPRGCTSP